MGLAPTGKRRLVTAHTLIGHSCQLPNSDANAHKRSCRLGGQILSVVPWSRLLDDQEAVLAINTDMDSPRSAWVTVDASLHKTNDKLRCIYSTDTAKVGAV